MDQNSNVLALAHICELVLNKQSNVHTCMSEHVDCDCLCQRKQPGNKLSSQQKIGQVVFSNFKRRGMLGVKSLSRVRLFATPWTVAQQAPPSMGFSRQEYWSGFPFPSPRYAVVVRNYNPMSSLLIWKEGGP